jgi:hypothetical protein
MRHSRQIRALVGSRSASLRLFRRGKVSDANVEMHERLTSRTRATLPVPRLGKDLIEVASSASGWAGRIAA